MPKHLWLLIIGMIINVTGSSFLWPLNTVYIHDHLGKSLTLAGLVLMGNAGAGVIGNLIGGALFDRVGGYRSILIGIAITFGSSIGLIFFHSFYPYMIFLITLGFGGGMVFPSMYAYAGTVWKEGGRKAYNAIYVAQNVGVAVGAAAGGLLASLSFQWIFIGNAIMYVAFFLLAFFGYRSLAHRSVEPVIKNVLDDRFVIKSRTRFRALIWLCAAYFICWLAYVQWQSTIASYTQDIGISLSHYSLLWTVNGAIIVLGQPLLAFIVKNWLRVTKTQIIVGISIFMISFLVASQANIFMGLMTAMIILTIGEMLVWPAVPTIAGDLAPKGREGFYQGVVNSTATGGRMFGPIVGGLIVDFNGIQSMFYVVFFLLIVSLIITFIYDRKIVPEASSQVA